MNTRSAADTTKLDELLALLEPFPQDNPIWMAYEHLWEARTYLLGAMGREYEMTMEMAHRSLAQIDDPEMREKAERLFAQIPGNS